MTTPYGRLHALVAHNLQAKPFTWVDARQAYIPPVEITALAHSLGADVVRAFGSSPEKSAVLIGRMPIRSIRDTVPPALARPKFRSFRRFAIGLWLILGAFLIPAAIVIPVNVATPRTPRIGGNSDGIHPLGAVLGGSAMLAFFGGLIAACFFYYKPAGSTLDERMAVYIGQFDGSDKVRIFAPHFRFPDLMVYIGIAHELGYDLHHQFNRPMLSTDDRFRLFYLSFRRRSPGHDTPGHSTPGPITYQR